MNVITDYHNGALYNSMHLLFEKRFGWNLFRPIGNEWFTNGYFRIAEPYGNAPETIGQYLDINTHPYTPYKNLNGGLVEKDGIYEIFDPENQITHKAITFDRFKEIEIDYIIATHPFHECWKNLLQFHPKAKFIMQLGNEGQTTDATNVLSSVWAYKPTQGQNICYYHQEFDLAKFSYEKPLNNKIIRSFVHLHPESGVFDVYQSALPEYSFQAYGMGTTLGPSNNLAYQMKESLFGWHIKPADGYGHVIHNWFACGRPIITKGNYYLGKTGGLLLEDGVNCIDLDKHTFSEILHMVHKFTDPITHEGMCLAAYKRFCDVVNFESEAESIKTFLSNIT
jgi:hypothetical protein